MVHSIKDAVACEDCNKKITKIARWIRYDCDTAVEEIKHLIEKAYKNDGIHKLESDYNSALEFAKDK
tara:strand:- start:1295 stop:1495 length:201 start_codon:yes stop_codon:yes gene_type:complete